MGEKGQKRDQIGKKSASEASPSVAWGGGEGSHPTGEEWHYKISVLELVVVVYVNLVDPAIFEVLQFFCNIRKLASLNKRKNNDCDILKAVEKVQILQLRANLEVSGQIKLR